MNKKYFIILFLILSLIATFFVSPFSSDDWHSPDHKARFLFVVDHTFIDEDLTDFPVLFKATSENDLYWKLRGDDDGNDLRIFTSSGVECAYEVVKHDPINYEYILYFNAPILYSYKDTDFIIYTAYDGVGDFDDPQNVWKNAVAIYHLEDETDSVGSNNLTPVNNPITVDGAVGKGYNLDGVNQYLDVGNPDFEFADKLTVMAWAKWDIPPSQGEQWANIVSIHDSSSGQEMGQFWLQHNYNNNHFEFAVRSNTERRFRIDNVVSTQQDQWYFVVGRYDGSRVDIHVNAIFGGQTSIGGTNVAPHGPTYQTNIGRRASLTPGRYFNGTIDEVWIFKDVKSSAFIKAVYYNSVDYQNFTSRSRPERVPEALIRNIMRPLLLVRYAAVGDLIIAETCCITGEPIDIAGEHIVRKTYEGRVINAVYFTRGSHEVTLTIANQGMFTQRNVRLRVEGLPEGASATFSPQDQIVRTKQEITFNAIFTIGPEVDPGVYKYTLILYNHRGDLGKREIYLFVE